MSSSRFRDHGAGTGAATVGVVTAGSSYPDPRFSAGPGAIQKATSLGGALRRSGLGLGDASVAALSRAEDFPARRARRDRGGSTPGIDGDAHAPSITVVDLDDHRDGASAGTRGAAGRIGVSSPDLQSESRRGGGSRDGTPPEGVLTAPATSLSPTRSMPTMATAAAAAHSPGAPRAASPARSAPSPTPQATGRPRVGSESPWSPPGSLVAATARGSLSTASATWAPPSQRGSLAGSSGQQPPSPLTGPVGFVDPGPGAKGGLRLTPASARAPLASSRPRNPSGHGSGLARGGAVDAARYDGLVEEPGGVWESTDPDALVPVPALTTAASAASTRSRGHRCVHHGWECRALGVHGRE
jgi:hypothetical protein